MKKGESLSDTLFQLQKQVILDIAEKENAIIVGRCADYILKDAGVDTLSVFIAAPLELRIRRTMETTGLDEKTVIALTKKKDKHRKAHYEKRTGQKWGDSNNYDMYFNAEDYTNLNEIAERIIEEYRKHN